MTRLAEMVGVFGRNVDGRVRRGREWLGEVARASEVPVHARVRGRKGAGDAREKKGRQECAAGE